MGIVLAMQGALSQGILWGLMALGVYITFRLLDICVRCLSRQWGQPDHRFGLEYNRWIYCRIDYGGPPYKMSDSCYFGRDLDADRIVFDQFTNHGSFQYASVTV